MDNAQRSTSRSQTNGGPGKLATGLGWFSIGLGAAELLAPSKVAQLVGLPVKDKRETVLRAYGWREIAAGIGILSQSRPAGWLWARVAGDAVDLASLGSCFKAEHANRTKVTLSTAAVLGVTALDVICARQMSSNGEQNGASNDSNVHITQSVTVNRSPEDLYGFWRDFSNLPKIMRHLEDVQITGDRTSHWKTSAPGGKTIEWDAKIVEDQPNRRIAWETLEDSTDVEHSGSVTFTRATGNRGTVVRVDVAYAPRGGRLTAQVAKLLRAAPGHFIGDELRAFKSLMETGEVAQSDASIHYGMHAARPPVAQEPTLASR
jgi:uncharacterized membrane protein